MDGRLTRLAKPWTVVLAVGLGLIGVYFLLPYASVIQSHYYDVFGLLTVIVIVIGIRKYQPADKLIWYFLALGSLFSVLADGVSTYYLSRGWDLPFPSLADALYLAAYPFLLAAVARLGRGASTYLARERRLDAAIMALAVLVLLWQPLFGAYAADSTLSTAGKITLMLYPIMDIAVVYILMSAIIFGGRRGPVDLLIGVSMGVMLVGDLTYDLLEQYASYSSGDLLDITWLLNYLLLAVAALHPAMAKTHTKPASSTPHFWWLIMVATAWLVPPTYLVAGSLAHVKMNVAGLAGVALVMALLATVRMGLMFQMLRERAAQLRQRTASLQDALVERDHLEDDLRHQAFHDPLTGLANRALLHERIEQALARSQREQTAIALVVCDLDGFKAVNDSLGHQVGDALLVAAARRLASVVRPGDTVARLGGDEFAALLDGVREPAIANRIAERIVSVLHEPTNLGEDAIAVSASVGLTLGTARNSAEELISDADAAMYEAKTQGKNRYVVFESVMRSRVMERLRFTTAFAGAIERGEFHLDYQPIFDLTDGTLQSFEALVRWNHPDMGLVAPLRFIPLAEETGFILPLGRWVLNTACKEATTWPTAPDGAPTVAVNISSYQLIDRGFVADVRGALNRSGLPGERLVLEVTEGMLITDHIRTLRVMNELKVMGVRVAVDDFGVGYSSLGELRRLPVDFVKIDKSFIDQIGDGDDEGRALVEAILRLAQDLDLTTVAEGIEVSSQRELLEDLGCNNGQGFLLSKPLDAKAAAALALRAGMSVRA